MFKDVSVRERLFWAIFGSKFLQEMMLSTIAVITIATFAAVKIA